MIDMQLLRTAVAGIGFASAAAVLVAVMILAIAAGVRERRRHHAAIPAVPAQRATATQRREPVLR
jgi:hypothetical protein